MLPGVDCAASTAPDHPNLEVTKRGGQCKRRKTYCFTRMSNEVNYAVYNNSLAAIERAVKERVFFILKDGEYIEPDRPTVDEFSKCVANMTTSLSRLSTFTTPMTATAFAESYQDRRKEIYRKAVAENKIHGFHDTLARVKAFVKVEKYNFTKKASPVPRIIQPRDPRYIVETGRYIKPIEKKIYNAIDHIFGGKTVFKGMNASNRGTALKAAWDTFVSPVAIGLDAARFDERVSNSALRWEHSIYQRYYPGDRHLSRLLRLQRNNKCSSACAEGTIKYTTKHNRMSGDSNTSLGNVLIMCSLINQLFRDLSINGKLINDGDDCVLIVESTDVVKLNDYIPSFFRVAGFDVVVEEPVTVFEHIVFCQSQPIHLGDNKYVMVRDPRTSISKDLVSLKPLDNKVVKERWLSAVGQGGLSLTSGIPVCQEFYTCLHRNANGARPLSDPTLEGGFFRLSKGMTAKYTEIRAETRLSFWLAFNVTPQEQLVIEDYYKAQVLTTGVLYDRFCLLPLYSN